MIKSVIALAPTAIIVGVTGLMVLGMLINHVIITRKNATKQDKRVTWRLLILVVFLMLYSSKELFNAYEDVYKNEILTISGIVEYEENVGNHSIYKAVGINDEVLYNPSEKFEIQIGAYYEIQYYKNTKFIHSIRALDNK